MVQNYERHFVTFVLFVFFNVLKMPYKTPLGLVPEAIWQNFDLPREVSGQFGSTKTKQKQSKAK
jgi:hypothetical protein